MYNLFYSVWGYRPVTAPNIPLSSLKDNVRDEDIGSGDYRFNPILSLTEEYRKRFNDNLPKILQKMKILTILGPDLVDQLKTME